MRIINAITLLCLFVCHISGKEHEIEYDNGAQLYVINHDTQDNLYDNARCLKQNMKKKDDQSKAWCHLMRAAMGSILREYVPVPTLLTIQNDNTKTLTVTLTYEGLSKSLDVAANKMREVQMKQYFPTYQDGISYQISGSLGLFRSTKSVWITPHYPQDFVLFRNDDFGTTLILKTNV